MSVSGCFTFDFEWRHARKERCDLRVMSYLPSLDDSGSRRRGRIVLRGGLRGRSSWMLTT